MRKERILMWLSLISFITHYAKCKKKYNVKDSTRIKLLFLKRKKIQNPLHHCVRKGRLPFFLSSVWAYLYLRGTTCQ